MKYNETIHIQYKWNESRGYQISLVTLFQCFSVLLLPGWVWDMSEYYKKYK